MRKKARKKQSKAVISGWQIHGILFFSLLCLCLFSNWKKQIYLVHLALHDPNLQSDGLLLSLHTFAHPPTWIPISLFSKSKFRSLHFYKCSLDTMFFSHHFFLWASVIAQLMALYATYQGHGLSPLIPKAPWETYMIISISLMRILCDAERLGNLHQSIVSLLFNYFVSLHALSLHQDYKH